ncbi:protein adenylyltransferase SelO [Rossellomorea vietnamensis]|uniref:protein adenylyltransferase SelO n=1 Tax=Rossellomorea vietnamensis TaxID=218284 RepID=UPI001E4EB5F0|nr:YdiU family protein [Rossellomorea vietnamensis]MCC5800955.1 YdiU family protein [Rossellomorea vietnamensis]
MMEKKAGWNLENSYQSLPGTFFTLQVPEPVRAPKLVVLNKRVAESLGLDAEKLGADVLSGNEIPEGAEPLAQAYAGHQFGHFNMLGDGRAVLIGEQITPEGKRFDIQLKGGGRTPYSRGGDGRAGLGPMLREHIISEAMHGLGIPTTRSLAVVTTGEPIYRETEQEGAILTRVAASHLRVGTFQFASRFGEVDHLRALADYALERHYPEGMDAPNRYIFLLKEVIKRQAALIAKWQMVGFIHGVMNTDNMTISGETIDYGPCAFMDAYDPKTVFSSIDAQGRYAYGNQPPIAGWNLARFAESLLPILHPEQEESLKLAQEAVLEFPKLYEGHWLDGMRAKLGIFNEEEGDRALAEELLDLMNKHQSDFTNTFRSLTLGREESDVFNTSEFTSWKERWKERLSRQDETMEASKQRMRTSNPSMIPRNHRVEEALQAAVEEDDFSVMTDLLSVLEDPYAYSSDQEEYCKLPSPTNRPYRTFCGT